jgi:spermidine dehydrogenase
MSRRRPDVAGSRLGMDRLIPRRDFMQGALVGTAAALAGLWLPRSALAQGIASQDEPGYYPPLLTGMRGAHVGSFEAAHALRDGAAVPQVPEVSEEYDLVVVGAGISGLAAAHFYRSRAPANSRILILDNHDDFGGHAKRNEFSLGGHMQLMNGGTLEIDSARPYSATAGGLLKELGIDLPALSRRVDRDYYEKHGLRTGVFFDSETFGADKLVVGVDQVPMKVLLKDAPLSAQTKADMVRLSDAHIDYMPGVSGAEKKDRLARMSYRDFLRDVVKVDAGTLAYYQTSTHGEYAIGIDAVPALDAWGYGLPGFQGLKLPPGATPLMGPTAAGYLETGGSLKLHFPDGNATIARLLVRKLIPEAIPGHTAEDIVTARADYSRLDRAGSPVRLRLNSIVVQARHAGRPDGTSAVEVVYPHAGGPVKVRARQCVLACWNMMIPYLCPEMPESQKAALHSLVKAPLVYVSVALANWQSFKRLGVHAVYSPGSYFNMLWLNQKVDFGDYHTVRRPEEPMLVHLFRTPCQEGLPEHDQNRAGRAQLLATPFETFEKELRKQLQRTLGPGGFDAARDVQAITVNRWPHGYSPEFNSLFEPWRAEAERPEVIGRARFGNITIANADAGAYAFTDGAIDQAARAVGELLAG